MRVKVEVSLTTQQFYLDDLSDDMTLADVLALLEIEADVPRDNMILHIDHKQIDIKGSSAKMLRAVDMKNNSVISVFNTNIDESQVDPAVLPELTSARDAIRNDPYQLSVAKQNNPEYADAILAPTLAPFLKYVVLDWNARARQQSEERRQRAALAADPFNIEAQRALEEQIRQENVEQLRQQAIEHMPEVFASVIMLYVDIKINGYAIKAFVDCGAQMTIMSSACAERCNLMRLVDRRYEGMAVGVGQQKILGRIHMCAMELAGSFLPTSFSILENQPMDILIGLDMLRRHQCIIDLKDNVLLIGTTGARAPFLSEAELPESARRTTVAADDQGAAATSPVAFPDDVIAELMALGFDRARVIEALRVCNGDRQLAASMLFSS